MAEPLPLVSPYAEIVTIDPKTGRCFDELGDYLFVMDVGSIVGFIRDYPGNISEWRPPLPPPSPLPPPPPGTNWVDPCRLKADGPVFTGHQTAPFEVDGFYTAVRDRILVVGQRKPEHDGIYTVGAKGHQGDTWIGPEPVPDSTATMVIDGETHEATTWIYDASSGAWLQLGGVNPVAGMAQPTKAKDVLTKGDLDKLMADMGKRDQKKSPSDGTKRDLTSITKRRPQPVIKDDLPDDLFDIETEED